MTVLLDRHQRPLGAIRFSVTDRCNLRCNYCMPEAEYAWLPRESLLSFDELARLARIFAGLGVTKVRLTGGEPLLRAELHTLVARIRGIPAIRDIALTTNGLLLGRHAESLRVAGLDRVTVSLDTLRPERMLAFARSPRHADVLSGVDAALAAGFGNVKLNSVVVRGYNDDEVNDLASFAWERDIEPRFIEYMDVGGATQWRPDRVVAMEEIVATLEARFGAAVAERRGDDPHAPATRFRFANGRRAGIVASTTAPFCRDCDRGRVTADGTFFLCLYARDGIDLRAALRGGATDDGLAAIIRAAWAGRADRGAEVRTELGARGTLVTLEGLRADPRKEMHVRGG